MFLNLEFFLNQDRNVTVKGDTVLQPVFVVARCIDPISSSTFFFVLLIPVSAPLRSFCLFFRDIRILCCLAYFRSVALCQSSAFIAVFAVLFVNLLSRNFNCIGLSLWL